MVKVSYSSFFFLLYLPFFFSSSIGHSLSNIIVSYLSFNSDFFIGVCSDLPLVRLVQESLFSFGKEKRQDVLVNNTRDGIILH